MSDEMKPVMVTTQHRGVFAGLVPAGHDMTLRAFPLKLAYMAIRFGTTKGVMELAHTGPTKESRISAPADIPMLFDVTAVFDVTPVAWARWTDGR